MIRIFLQRKLIGGNEQWLCPKRHRWDFNLTNLPCHIWCLLVIQVVVGVVVNVNRVLLVYFPPNFVLHFLIKIDYRNDFKRLYKWLISFIRSDINIKILRKAFT